jgi:hypothetical protein
LPYPTTDNRRHESKVMAEESTLLGVPPAQSGASILKKEAISDSHSKHTEPGSSASIGRVILS